MISTKHGERMLIDEFMPVYDVVEHHATTVRAPAERVYATIRTADIFGSPIARFLFFLRGLPLRLSDHNAPRMSPKVSINTLLKEETFPVRFILLGENSPHEFVVGTVIRNQTAYTEQYPLPQSAEYYDFTAPGMVKAVLNLVLTENPDGTTRLETETRVVCLDSKTRRRFRVYWLFIGHFSSLIRVLMLRAMKREAEAP
jgi:hypothetical protein